MLYLGEPTFDNQKQTLLGPSQLQVAEVFVLLVDSSILDVIRCGIPSDTFAQQILDHIDPQRASCSTRQRPQMDYKKFTWHNELLYYNGLLYVLDGLARFKSSRTLS
jgi:hypothetical protein